MTQQGGWYYKYRELTRFSLVFKLKNLSLLDLQEGVCSPFFYPVEDSNLKWKITVKEIIKKIFFGKWDVKCLRVYATSHSEELPTKVKFYIFTISADKQKAGFQEVYTDVSRKSFSGFEFVIRLQGLGKCLYYLPSNRLTLLCQISYFKSFYDCELYSLLPIIGKFNPKQLGSSMWEKKLLCDATFLINGKELKAHKAALASVSPYFEAMFSHNMKENLTNIIEIEDISFATFEKVIEFLYTGKLKSKIDMKEELLFAADKYIIPELKDTFAIFDN